MRFLLVNYEYPPVGGGAATATQALGQALVKGGHEVTVLTGRYKDLPSDSVEQGIRVRRIASLRRVLDRASIVEMGSFMVAGMIIGPFLMKRLRIEAVIVFFSIPSGPIGLLGRWTCGVPYVVALRGGDVPGNEPSLSPVHRLLRPLRRAVLQKSIAIVANSDGLRKAAEAADDFPVRVIPNGTDQAVFDSKGAVLEVGRPLQILFVGRFRAQKNVAYLLRQVAQLPPGSFQLHLVGEGPDQQTLGQLAVRLRIDRFITWHGWLSRSALRDVYCTADCLVNPSIYEGMPNVVLEAMAAGLPVIASNVPGNDELVKPGETGFLFELADGKDLRNALDALRDATVRARMGAAGRARARAWPTWEEVARRYLELFRGNGEPAAN